MAFKKKSTPGITKSTPPNEWFRNAARSMKLASMDLVQSVTPATGEFIVDNAEYAKSLSETLKDARRNNKPLTDVLNAGKTIGDAKKLIKNAKDDIRSGNFYNTSRMAEDMEAEFGMGEDFDFLDIEGDLMNDDEDSTTIVKKNTQVNVVSSTAPVIKALEGNAKVTVNAAEAIMGANQNIAERTISINQKTSLATIKGLSSINDNLSLLVNFQNDSMSKYIGASIKYYEESINEMKQTTSAMLRAYPVQTEEQTKKKGFDIFGAYGGLNLQEYSKQVKHNLRNSSNELVMFANTIFSDENFLEAIIDSPLKSITNAFAKKLIPASTQAMLDNFDQTFASFAPAMMMRLNRWKSDDANPLQQLVADLFGVKTNTKSSIDSKAYDRGPMQWNGIANRTLVEVIPRHLSAIESAITGQAERMFDYQKGQWSSVDVMREELDKRTQQIAMSGYSDLTGEMKEILNGIKFTNKKERENIDNHMTNFFTNMTKYMESQVNFNKLDEMTGVYDFGGDNSMAQLIQGLILAAPKNVQMNAAGAGQIQSREALRKFYEDLEKDPSQYNAGLLSSKAGLNGRMEKDPVTGKLVAKKGMGIASIDKYGKDNLDYLRDILVTLQSGIRVCDDCGADGKRKGPKSTSDYRNEFNSRISKREQEESSYLESQRAKLDTDNVYNINRENRQGNIVATDVNDLMLDYGSAQGVIEASRNLRGARANINPESNVRKYGNKLSSMLSGEAQSNFNAIVDKVDDLVNQPAKILKATFDKIDASMYNMVFGIKTNGQESMLAATMNKIQDMLGEIGDFGKEKIFKPMTEFMLGENGIWGKSKENPIAKSMGDGIKKFFMGGLNDKGEYEPGAFGGVKDSLSDMRNATIHMISGKEYKDSKGNIHPNDTNSVFGLFKSGAKSVLSETQKYITGDKDSNDPDKRKGAYGDIANTFKDSIGDWREAIFGPKDNSELKKKASESFAEVRYKIGKGMPKGIVGAIGGGAAGAALISAMGPLGVMGAAVLPGGPLGFALAGAALGIGTESNRFMEWAFGVENDNGKRTGGAILKANQLEFLKRNKSTMIGGAAIGAASNMLGFGLLPAFLGPAGPLGAALLGAGTGLVLRSEKAQEFLFGPKNLDGKRMGGAISKIFSPITNKMNKNQDKDVKRHMMNMGIGAGGGLALGTAISSLGLMGAMFSPMAPVGLAVTGLAAGMSLNSERWRKFMFGEWTEDGDRKGGLAQKFTNWSQVNIMDPMKMKVTETVSDMNFWFKDTVVGSLKYSFEPIKDAAVFAGKDLVSGMKFLGKGFNSLVGKPMNDNLLKPVAKALETTLVGPAKFIIGKTVDIHKGLFKGLAGIPFKLLEGTAKLADTALMARGVAFGAGRNVRNIFTGDNEGKTRMQSLRGLFSMTEHGANAWSQDGSQGYAARYSERVSDHIANRQQRKDEYKAQRAERKLWKGRKGLADAAGYDSFDEFDNDNRFLFNTTKKSSAFDNYIKKQAGGADDFNKRLNRMYGVSAQELLELRDDRDLTKITKGQRKDLANKLKRAGKLGLQGDDLLSALGVERVKVQGLEQKSSEATIKIADDTSVIASALKENPGFDINDDSQANKLKSIIADAMGMVGGIPLAPSGPTISEPSVMDSDEEVIDTNGRRVPKGKRKKKKFLKYLKDNMSAQGISAFGKRVSLYEDEDGYGDADQDELRRQVQAKMGGPKSGTGAYSNLTDALMSLSEGIPVRVINASQFGGGMSEESSGEGTARDVRSNVRTPGEVLSRRSTSTLGLGSLIGGVGNVASGVGGLLGRIGGGIGSLFGRGKTANAGGTNRGGIGASILGGGSSTGVGGILGMLNSMTNVGRRVGSSLNAAYSANSASRILGSETAGTSAQASDNFSFVDDGTSEQSQRQNFAKRRNVNDFLSKKAQESSALMESKFKHSNIDLLSQVSINTRMIAELLSNQYDLDHGFYSWLRSWLENFKPCCGGGGGGFGGGVTPAPTPGPGPVTNPIPNPFPNPISQPYLMPDGSPFTLPSVIPLPLPIPGKRSKAPGRVPTPVPLPNGTRSKNPKPVTNPTTNPTPSNRPVLVPPLPIPSPKDSPNKNPKPVTGSNPTPSNRPVVVPPVINPSPKEQGKRRGVKLPNLKDFVEKFPTTAPGMAFNNMKGKATGAAGKAGDALKGLGTKTKGVLNITKDFMIGKGMFNPANTMGITAGSHITADMLRNEYGGKSVAKTAAKSGLKSGAKLALGAATGGLATLAFGAMDAHDGYKNAAAYLGKDKASTADKVGVGASRAVMGGIPFADAIDQAFFNGKINEKLMEVSTGVTNGVANLGTKLGETWTNVGTTVSDKTEGMKKTATEKFEGMKTTISEKTENLKTATAEKFESMRSTASEKFENTKTAISEKTESIKAAAQSKFESAKKTASEKFEGAKTAISTKAENIRSAAADKFESAKKTASEKFENAKTSISTKTGEIATSAKTKFESALTNVNSTLKDFGSKIGTVASKIGTKIKDLLDIDTSTISSYMGDFASTIGGIASSIGSKIASLARKGLDAVRGKGQGSKVQNVGGSPNSSLESLMTNESKSFLNKVGNLKTNIADIKAKKSTFAKGDDPFARITDLIGEGKIPSDEMFDAAFGNGDVYYSQKDAKWGSKSLGGGSTMSTSGCGPTAASMVISSMTGENIDPVKAAEFAQRRGYVDPTRGVSSDLFADLGSKTGVNFDQIKPKEENIEKALREGNQLILRGQGNGDFTDGGHYVVANGIDKNGNVKIKDPLGKNRSGSKPLSRLLKGTTHAFEATRGNGDGKVIMPKVTYGKGSAFSSPAPGSRLTSAFGYRDIGDGRGRHFHFGIDLASAGTVPIQAVAAGEVTKAEFHSTYGNVVIIKHTVDGKRMDSVYAHLRANMQVRVGEQVKQGQVVGYMGNTGRSTGQHLHFEIHNGPYTYKGGSSPTAIDPAPLVLGSSVSTPNPFFGVNGGSDGGASTNKSQADTLMDKFNSMFKTPEAYLQLEHALDIGTKNLLFGTDDEIGLYNQKNGSSGSSDGTVPALSGNQVSEKVWNFFKDKGFTTSAIAGVMGNLQQESGMDPTKRQNGGTAKGIAQWEGGRWTNLVNKATSRGVSEWDLPIQLQHIWDELNGDDPTTKAKLDRLYGGVSGLKNSTDYKWATKAFEDSFERAGKPNYPRRYDYAQQYLNLYGGKADGVGGPGYELPDFDIDLYNNNQNVGGPITTSEFSSTLGKGFDLDTRFSNSSVDEVIEKQNESERIVVETHGNGTGGLTREDVDKVLSYLSTIADNTSDSGVRVVNSSSPTNESTAKKHAGKKAETAPVAGKGDNAYFPNQRGNNNNNVDQRTYNRIKQVTRGRRN